MGENENCTTFECGGPVTVCTTCAEGETPEACARRHEARVDAAKKALGC